jgi:hypothetical protein
VGRGWLDEQASRAGGVGRKVRFLLRVVSAVERQRQQPQQQQR